MSNGLVNFKCLGACGCGLLFAFASLAQTTDSDYIEYIYGNTTAIQSELVSISSKLGYTTYGKTLQDDMTQISGYAELLYQLLYGASGSSPNSSSSIYTYDKTLNYRFQDFKSQWEHYSFIQTNQFSRMADSLENINDAINNLTNYMCYSQEYVSGVVTNFPAFLAFVDDLELNPNSLRTLFYALYNRYPDIFEASYFLDLLRDHGVGSWIRWASQLLVNYYSLPENIQNEMYPYYRSNPVGYSISEAEAYAKAYYYQYGTRPLIELLESWTNNTLAAVSEPLETDSNGNPKLSQKFIDATDSIEHYYTPHVSTNVATISTNEITNVQNDSFAGQLDRINGQNLENEDFGADIRDVVEGINNQFVSFIPQIDETTTFDLGLGTFSIFGVSKEISISLSKLPDKYFKAQKFLFSVLRAIVLLVVCNSLYTALVKDSQL